MSTRRKSVRGSMVLTLGEGVIYGSSFARNMILARVLTKADFGISATFSMILMLLEFSAKLGISRFVVRDKEGNEPEFLATAHLVQVLAAVLSSVLMLIFAWPLAKLFSIVDHVGAVMVLSLLPIMQGLSHLDVRRFERELRFGPSTVVEMIPQLAITLAAWPVARAFGDYRAVVALLLFKAFCSCVGSHLLAKTPYRWKVHREYFGRMLRFGWPLLVTGFLMFGVLQGDQSLVASFYTMSDLGPYAAAASLTMAPTFFFGRVFNSVALSLMAKVQDDRAAFERRYRLIIAVICAFSVTYAVGMIVGAEALMRFVYGTKYAGSGVILGWLSAANAFRNIRIAPAIAAMARGDSKNQMVSNMARVMAIIPAFAVAASGQPIWMIACNGLFGEALACAVSFRRLSQVHGVRAVCSLVPTGCVAATVGVAGFLGHLGAHRLPPLVSLAAAALGGALAGAIVGLALEDSRHEALRFLADWRRTGWLQRLPWLKPRASTAKTSTN